MRRASLYEDLTPKPEPSAAPPPGVGERDAGSGRPTKQERRAIDRLMGETNTAEMLPCVACGHCASKSVRFGRSSNDLHRHRHCIKCKYMDCVEVCPVDCFYEGENFLVIHPDECIDCGVCEPECPVDAIKPDTEPGRRSG